MQSDYLRSGAITLALSLAALSCSSDDPQDEDASTPGAIDAATPGADGGAITDPPPVPCLGCLDTDGGCAEGLSDTACGSNGNSCTVCSGDQSCQGGTCVASGCGADSCDSCCGADGCYVGVEDAACGAGGQVCQTCLNGFACSTSDGACVLTFESEWETYALSGVVPATTLKGASWDVGAGAYPDVFVRMRVKDGKKTIKGKTKSIKDDITPEWNEAVLSGIAAEVLLQTITVEVRDNDWPLAANSIGSCELTLSAGHFQGLPFDFVCDADESQSGYSLILQLVPITQ